MDNIEETMYDALMNRTGLVPVLKLALRSLAYKEVLLCVFSPLLLAALLVLFIVVTFGTEVFLFFGEGIRGFIASILVSANFLPPQLKELLTQALFGAGGAIGLLFFVVLMVPVFIAVGSLVASVISSTYLISFLAGKHFPGLKRQGSLGLIKAQLHALAYSGIYLLASVAALPLVFFPPISFAVQVALTARLTQKITAYDVLGDWCSENEFSELMSSTARPAFAVSFVASLTMVLPFAFIITPVLTALTLTIYYFSALEDLRKFRNKQ